MHETLKVEVRRKVSPLPQRGQAQRVIRLIVLLTCIPPPGTFPRVQFGHLLMLEWSLHSVVYRSRSFSWKIRSGDWCDSERNYQPSISSQVSALELPKADRLKPCGNPGFRKTPFRQFRNLGEKTWQNSDKTQLIIIVSLISDFDEVTAHVSFMDRQQSWDR